MYLNTASSVDKTRYGLFNILRKEIMGYIGLFGWQPRIAEAYVAAHTRAVSSRIQQMYNED